MAFGRLAIAGLITLFACAPLACGSLLGIDSGTPRKGDASTTVDSFPDVFSPDAFMVDDGGLVTDSGYIADTFVPLDTGTVCTPDLNWCETHCGTGPDNCGQMRGCGTQCPSGQSCIANVCTCEASTGWCTGRCENTTDNCGNPVNCGECDGGAACYSNTCGCMPDPVSTTCAGKQCGAATNNCNLTVNCGANNTTACDSGDFCKPDDTCCTPDNSICAGRCNITLTNNCGEQVPCPAGCANGGVCLASTNTCCVPSGCGGACVDNCGQQNNSCCPTPPPDAGCISSGCGGACIDNCGHSNSSCCPPDSGGPPDTGGGCGGPGASCSSCCSGLLCGYNFTCVTSCEGQGAACSTPSDCCYPYSCSGVATATASPQGVTPFDGGIVQLGTCQP